VQLRYKITECGKEPMLMSYGDLKKEKPDDFLSNPNQ
jgi:hypothetical protein